MPTFDGLTPEQAREFAARWLPAGFPDWVWTQSAATPMAGGFLNHWHAEIPVGEETLAIDGVCTVRLRDGLIERNEVFFDRSELLAAMRRAQAG